MKEIKIPEQTMSLYEFSDLADDVKFRMIADRIKCDLETGFYTDDCLYQDCITYCDKMRFPWFYSQMIYDRGKDIITQSFVEADELYTKDGHCVSTTKDILRVLPNLSLMLISEKEDKSELKREIILKPAFDKTAKKGGCLAAILWFVLTGPGGAVTLSVNTNWHVESKRGHLIQRVVNHDDSSEGITQHRLFDLYFTPHIMALSTHKRVSAEAVEKADYDGRSHCDWLDGDACIGGCTYLADEFVTCLVNEGSDALWEKMTKYYIDTIEKGANDE